MSGYCDAQANGQPLCSVQCAQCIGEEGLAELRAENARLREALENVRAEERARCVGVVEGMPNHKSASMFGSFEGRVEHLDAITRADVLAALNRSEP